jgi:hypothetical protein
MNIKNAKYLKVEAGVRYWDDAIINGEQDEEGKNVPFKDDDTWVPVIDLDGGSVVDWPEGVEADFHFKVCDSGTYHLLDDKKEVIASRFDNYVPDGLCHGSDGWGDYIIFNVGPDGKIDKYRKNINPEDWRED